MATVGCFVIPPLESEPTNPFATALNRCINECESMISIKYDGRISRRENKMSRIWRKYNRHDGCNYPPLLPLGLVVGDFPDGGGTDARIEGHLLRRVGAGYFVSEVGMMAVEE